ncbi:MAG: hypothetical protein V2J07_10705 [Anaerolineae bacterium]|jgi:hypothetical protein|nr:hypothetical protein [Anaerolineae bacterium]
MNGHSELWKQWNQKLSQWQLRSLTVTLIEGSAIIHPIIAQFVLIGQPMFGQTARKHLDAIIELLEDPQLCKTFTDTLIQESIEC